MRVRAFSTDARWFQIIFQAIFLIYGICFLQWEGNWPHYTAIVCGCLLFQYLADSLKYRQWQRINQFKRWGFSILISAMSLCLLLKTSHWSISLFAALATVSGKYLVRFRRSHLCNPSALGIVAVLLFTNQAWVSPGQWGSNAFIFFFVATLGVIVITRAQRLDTSLAFLTVFLGLLFYRQVIYLGWPIDFFLHSASTGSLLLFSFFMISDPKTSPRHPLARYAWAVLIAAGSFFGTVFLFEPAAMIFTLVAASLLVPLFNHFLPAPAVQWATLNNEQHPTPIKRIKMNPYFKKPAALGLIALLFSQELAAFCGFYVAKADGTLTNKTSQVIFVRDGNRSVITMYNDYKGDLKDFALVVPVPVVLKQKDIRVIDQRLFTSFNEYSKPRLVEYFDEAPCQTPNRSTNKVRAADGLQEVVVTALGISKSSTVKIEAQYLVGEYDILILSAGESGDLQHWLTQNGYQIPAGAAEVLAPYIRNKMKFFVVTVNEAEKKKLPGDFLRPIQISFQSANFMLPIRLGMANADGDQDLIVYALTREGRIETTNYRTVSLPTGNQVPLFVQKNFSAFYTNLFQFQWEKQGRSVSMLEYAWDISPKNTVKCDPCVFNPPNTQDLVQAGVWWLTPDWNNYDDVYAGPRTIDASVHFTRLHIRYNRQNFPQDLQFQITPNTENFQARYVITHPADGDFDCEAGKKYLVQLDKRRRHELGELSRLTGRDYGNWDLSAFPVAPQLPYLSLAAIAKKSEHQGRQSKPLSSLYIIALAGSVVVAARWRRKRPRQPL